MANDDDESGARRRISASEVDAIARVQSDIAAENRRAEKLHKMELRDAEWFGADGKGGKLAAMEATMKEQGATLDVHEKRHVGHDLFQAKIGWLVAGLATAGGILTAVAFKLADHFMR